jgi:flavodoxin
MTEKAVVVYQTRTGNTRQFAEEIGDHLAERGIETVVLSIDECSPDRLQAADYVLLGCWTQGLFVVLQHPDDAWIGFVRGLPAISRPKVGIFATYMLATGRMFGQMRKHLAGKVPTPVLELKTKDAHLHDEHRRALDGFVAGG